MKTIAIAALAAASLFAVGCRPAETPKAEAKAEAWTPGPGEPTLEELKALTEKYKDVKVALAEGYVQDPSGMCEVAENMGRPASDGAMGIHYVLMSQAGVTAPPNPRVDGNGVHTDFRKPTVLLYEPQADGSLALVGVENLVFEAAWKAAGHTAPPTFHGKPYEHMADDPATPLDEAHNFMPHYDRHVWIHRENPKGVFTPFNPAVTCQHHKGPKMPPMKGM